MYEHRFQSQSNPDLRVGDSEREQAADRLRRAHGEGRLDAEELQERIERCYRAKTTGELHELVADLPGDHRHGEPRSGRQFRLLPWWRLVLPILFAVMLVCAVSHGHHGHAPWALVPLLFLGLFWVWRRRPHFGRSL